MRPHEKHCAKFSAAETARLYISLFDVTPNGPVDPRCIDKAKPKTNTLQTFSVMARVDIRTDHSIYPVVPSVSSKLSPHNTVWHKLLVLEMIIP